VGSVGVLAQTRSKGFGARLGLTTAALGGHRRHAKLGAGDAPNKSDPQGEWAIPALLAAVVVLARGARN
jgi:hypothetical protein